MDPQAISTGLEDLFIGDYEMTVDTKQRLGVPKNFMEVLKRICPDQANVIGVIPTPKRSIQLLPYPEFMKRAEKWRQLSGESEAEEILLTTEASMAGLLSLDAQNRLRLSPTLMRYCDIQRDVVVVGNGRFMNVYDVRRFEERIHEDMARKEEARRQLRQQGEGREPIQQVVLQLPEAEKQSG